MSAAGTWKLTIATPLGEQTPVLTLTEEGDTLTGQMVMPGAAPVQVKEGFVTGNTIKWTSDIKTPVAVTLNFSVTLRGDSLSGECTSTMFPSFPVRGQRA